MAASSARVRQRMPLQKASKKTECAEERHTRGGYCNLCSVSGPGSMLNSNYGVRTCAAVMLPGQRLVTSFRSSAVTDSTTRLLVPLEMGSPRYSWLPLLKACRSRQGRSISGFEPSRFGKWSKGDTRQQVGNTSCAVLATEGILTHHNNASRQVASAAAGGLVTKKPCHDLQKRIVKTCAEAEAYGTCLALAVPPP